MTSKPVSHSAPPDDAEILDALQERMERIIRGDSPNAGRFCGYCYARLEAEQDECPVCGRATAAIEPVPRVPRDALRVYNAHRRKMQLWVNLFAFGGILLSLILAGLILTFFATPWNYLAVVMMFFGSWYFANLMGGGLGAMLGTRQGVPLRAAKWRELLERRSAGENLDAR